jgi:serine/threonine protein phosphatase PrpC
MIDDSEIHKLLQQQAADLKALGRTLIEAANQAGGEDNITVVLARFSEAKPSLEDTQPTNA